MSPQVAFAGAAVDAQQKFIKAVNRMMVTLAPQNARVSATVRTEYRDHLNLLVLNEYEALEDALYTGGLVPLPAEAERFNIRIRTDGHAPIAEKDLDRQSSYIAARPATIGALIDIASRVKSGPIEITSMVRHTEYQDALRESNANANTSVPMHTMGLAFDIALVNTPLETIYETRNVLQQMQEAGDILFIGERRQLVFHVVPHPSRLGYFTQVYSAALAASLEGAPAIHTTSVNRTLTPLTEPVVETEVIALSPTEAFANEWWSVPGAHSDLIVEVSPPAPPVAAPIEQRRGSFFGRIASFFGGVLTGARTYLLSSW